MTLQAVNRDRSICAPSHSVADHLTRRQCSGIEAQDSTSRIEHDLGTWSYENDHVTTSKVEKAKATLEAWVVFLSLALAIVAVFAAVFLPSPGRGKAVQIAIAFSLCFLVAMVAAVARQDRVGWMRHGLRVIVVAAGVAAIGFSIYVMLQPSSIATGRVDPPPSSAPVLEVIGIMIASILLFTGIRKVEVGGFLKTVLSIADLVLLIISFVLLGWVGFVLFVVTNLIALVVSSVRIYMRQESLLTYAGIQANEEYSAMKDLDKELRRAHKSMRTLGPIERAQLISALAERSRGVDEIRQMANPIAMLHVVHRIDLQQFAGEFDRILRLYGKDASESMALADQLTVATKQSAATFQEMVEAMIAAASP